MFTLNGLFQWLNAHPNLSGLATFIISAAESVAIIGTIIPGTIMMTAIGTLAGAGVIPLYSTIIWATLGAIVGDGISYWLGYKFKDRIRNTWPFKQHPGILEKGEFFFHTHGGKSVFIGRFVGPVRALVPLVAGMLGMKPWRFYIFNVASAIGWAPAYMLPGIALGAASLELPPDIAVRAILMLFLVLLFGLFCIWFIQTLLFLINKQIEQMLNRIWTFLKKTRAGKIIVFLIKHYDKEKTHGQLILAFYFILTVFALTYLAFYIAIHGSNDIFLNQVFFHLFRSLRNPNVDNLMLWFTFLGEKKVFAFVVAALFGWLLIKKHWRTAQHVALFGVVVIASSSLIKNLVHSRRPWGILHPIPTFSFPSGHATLSMSLFLGLSLLLIEIYRFKKTRVIFSISTFIVIFVGLSRIYLGAHWFTDIIGGWLLAIAILMFLTLSYNRKPPEDINPKGVLITVFLSLIISITYVAHKDFNTAKETYKKLDWPVYTVSLNAWWNLNDKHLPIFRINRFGLSVQVLNLQWLGSLTDIKQLLLANGWQEPPKRDWISVLHRVSDVKSTEHLPLVSPVYLDKNPTLVLIKNTPKMKLVVLRLWDSNIIIQDQALPLWVGSIEIIPRSYSWLLRPRHTTQIEIPLSLLFGTDNGAEKIKQISVKVKRYHGKKEQQLTLIKPA